MGSRLAGLHRKGALARKSLTISRNLLGLRGSPFRVSEAPDVRAAETR